MMIFSCGHDNKNDSGFYGHRIMIAGHDRMFERCVRYMTVCDRCKSTHEVNGEVLQTEEQVENWLKGDK